MWLQPILCLEARETIKIKNPTLSLSRHKSYGDGSAYSLMVGFGETYFGAFALSLGLGDVFTGMMTTVPLVFGGLLQLFAPRGIALLGSVKKWVIFCALVQSLSHLPLILGALFGKLTHPQLLLIVVVYWSAGLSGGPAWNYWIGKLIAPADLRHFFAMRNMFSQISALVAFIGAGLFLHFLSSKNLELLGFALLFSGAFICRILSVYFLSQHPEVSRWEEETTMTPSLRDGFSHFIKLKGLAFLCFLLLMQWGANTASPFFSPYMLGALKLTYEEYTFLIAGTFTGKILFGPFGGTLVKHAGTQTCLFFSACIISITPQLWVYSQDLTYLFLLQVMAGTAWATFELTSTLLIFEKVELKERMMGLTYYTMMQSIATFLGASLGGGFLEYYSPTVQNYWTLFSMSTALRSLAVGVLCFQLLKNHFGKKTETLKA